METKINKHDKEKLISVGLRCVVESIEEKGVFVCSEHNVRSHRFSILPMLEDQGEVIKYIPPDPDTVKDFSYFNNSDITGSSYILTRISDTEWAGHLIPYGTNIKTYLKNVSSGVNTNTQGGSKNSFEDEYVVGEDIILSNEDVAAIIRLKNCGL